MPPVDLRSVKDVLDRALELPASERASFVAEACCDDEPLRLEVESLLEQEDATQPWCEGPILQLLSREGSFEGFQKNQRIGAYRVVRTLGEGGMGAVALAVRQDDFKKRVALKVVKPDRISDEMTRRFENERQILAQLEHPNIARILDGGTTSDGFPYFVMEYVEGRPLDDYCEGQELSIRQRLRLFLKICTALQLAHQSLVVHRDLKPSNILITADGVPKLLDFGIAKRLKAEPGTEVTRFEHRPMSLRYASPEQIIGGPITTGVDIYSLGVLLYELLAGRHPFASRVSDALKLAQAIRDEEPRAPSSAASDPVTRRSLTGDLDSIVLKAIRKPPDRRYRSVESLADDIRCYLDGQPVSAREGTWAYRTGKFVRRNKLPLAAATTLLLLSVAFGLTVTVLWRQAVDQREQAVFERMRSQQVLDFMKESFRASGPNRSRGEEITAREILESSERNIDEGLNPLLQAELLTTIGDVYANLGLYDQARGPWQRAEHLLRRLYPDGHPKLAWAINNLASWHHLTGEDTERAEKLYREALAMKLRLPPDDIIDIAKSWSNLASILMQRGAYDEAEALYRQSLDMRQELYGDEDPTVATTLRSLGVLYYTKGDLERAEPLLLRSLELREQLYDPGDTRIATALTSLARLRHAQGRFDIAEQFLTRALTIRKARFDDDHPHIVSCELDLARLYLDAGTPEKGADLLDRSLDALRKTKREGSWEVAEAESVLGGYLTVEGRYEEAEQYLIASYQALVETRGDQAVYTRDARHRLGKLYLAQGKTDQAAAYGVAIR